MSDVKLSIPRASDAVVKTIQSLRTQVVDEKDSKTGLQVVRDVLARKISSPSSKLSPSETQLLLELYSAHTVNLRINSTVKLFTYATTGNICQSSASTSGTAYCRIAEAGFDQNRTGKRVRLLHSNIRANFAARQIAATPSAYKGLKTRFVMARDKMPVLGSIWAEQTNPAANYFGIMNDYGTTPSTNICATRNVMALPRYHVYHDEVQEYHVDADNSTLSNAGNSARFTHLYIDYHKAIQTYTSTNGASIFLNDLIWFFMGDAGTITTYAPTMDIVIDTYFEDLDD